ncbi:hypothetical protein ABEF95_007075 [Exophiala dermatitidis]
MPPFPGEETLITVYADVHIYFDAPTRRPFLHRFDKASYFYIYYNSTRQTSRIEVALHPGTPDQAAFNGFLDNVKIINSHTFPTKVTLIVDGLVSSPLGAAASPSSAHPKRDPDEWRLPSADPRDPGINKYRVHTVDFYFWVQEDAKLVVDIFKRLLQPQQLEVDDEGLEPELHDTQKADAHYEQEATPHHDMVSPVVQNLEHVAISDPAYHKDDNHRDRHESSSSSPTNPRTTEAAAQPHVQAQSPSPASTLPQGPTAHAQVTSGPSISPSPGTSTANSSVQQRAPSVSKAAQPQPQPPPSSTNFTPLAYNPAAPAAPEPIAHREDTPPPVDGMDGTGLAAAAKHDGIPGIPSAAAAAAAGGYPQTYQGQSQTHAPFPPHIGTHPQGAAAGTFSPPPQANPNPNLYNVNQYGAPSPQPPSFGPSHASASMSLPPQHTPSLHAPAASPPQPHATAPSFGPPQAAAGMTSSPAASFSSSRQQQQHPTSPRTSVASSIHHHYGVPSQDPNAHIFGASGPAQSSPVQTPGSQFYNSLDGTHKPLQHIQPQYPDYLAAGGHTQPGHHVGQQPPPPPPVGGYSNYHYSGQSPPHSNTNPYDIHHQVYRPTEQEHHTHHHSKPSRSSSSSHKPSQAERIEKGVGKLFKRIEKKIG